MNALPSPAREEAEPLRFLNLSRQYARLRQEILSAVDQVLASGQWILGPEVRHLEEELASRCGAPSAVAVGSGTDALYLSLRAAGIGPGDDVVVPTFTFFATAGAVSNVGARPVFCDVSPETFNVTAETLEAALTPRTRAVIPVHLFGHAAPMDEIAELAAQRGLIVVEDAAQSLGARWKGRPVGSWGDFGAFSFYPTKNLGGCGDGGLVVAQRPEHLEALRRLRVHGAQPKYHHHEVGINSRLDAVQAAILRVKLRHLEAWVARRREHAAFYSESLGDIPGLRSPRAPEECDPVWNQYTVVVEAGDRDALRRALAERGVPTEVYYPEPLHLQPCFRGLGYREGDLPVAERLCRQVLSLPMDPEMTPEERERVVEALREVLASR
jgi:dTDP-4-amino-4,6-dideoxygalactose transaminase